MAKPRAPLFALALAAFGIGTTEFVIMGLLPEVAGDLGVGLPAAGLLVSGYALGVATGGPLLTLLMARVAARPALLGLVGLFILGNLGCALAPNYDLLMLARIVTAFCHAAFFGLGAVIAARLASAGRRAQAIALMVSGLTLANVLGVPLGTFVGQMAGWRVAFFGVALIGAVALATLAFSLPSIAVDRNPRAEIQALKTPEVFTTLAVSVIVSTSMFGFFTYVAPILTELAGVATRHVGPVLLLVGLGLTAGNFLGARLADWYAGPALIGVLVAAAAVLLMLAGVDGAPVLATALLTLWGVFAFAVCAITQAMVVDKAAAAPNLASTLNISAFNLGNAIGAGLSAALLSFGVGLPAVPAVAAVVALLAAGLSLTALLRSRRSLAVDGKCRERHR